MTYRPPTIVAYRRSGTRPRRLGITSGTKPSTDTVLLIKGGFRDAGRRARLTLVNKKAS